MIAPFTNHFNTIRFNRSTSARNCAFSTCKDLIACPCYKIVCCDSRWTFSNASDSTATDALDP